MINPSAFHNRRHHRRSEQALRAGFKYIYTAVLIIRKAKSTYCANGSVALSREDDYLLAKQSNQR